MIIAPSWQWTSASWFAYVCTYCWFSIKYFSFCLFQSWMSLFSLWSSSDASYIFVTNSTPGHVFLNLYIFWTAQQPLGFSAPIVKSEYNFTNGGYGTPPKKAVSVNLQNKFATVIEVFLHLHSHWGFFYIYPISCLHAIVCEPTLMKYVCGSIFAINLAQKENVWMLNLNGEYVNV